LTGFRALEHKKAEKQEHETENRRIYNDLWLFSF